MMSVVALLPAKPNAHTTWEGVPGNGPSTQRQGMVVAITEIDDVQRERHGGVEWRAVVRRVLTGGRDGPSTQKQGMVVAIT
jgi:hypothetical protein